MAILRLHHSNITIPSGTENEAHAFYCDLLGLEEIEKPEALQANGGIWLRLENLDIHIGTQDGIARDRLKMHLAFQVEDLVAWREKIEAANIPTQDNTPTPDFIRFEIRDPFGNRLEFLQVI